MAHADCSPAGARVPLPSDNSGVLAHMNVRRKIVYFTVGQRKEVAVFQDETPSDDVKSKPLFICIT